MIVNIAIGLSKTAIAIAVIKIHSRLLPRYNSDISTLFSPYYSQVTETVDVEDSETSAEPISLSDDPNAGPNSDDS